MQYVLSNMSYVLASKPSGMIKESDLKLVPLNLQRKLEPNRLLLKSLYISVDPFIRVRLDQMKPGEAVSSVVVSEVIKSSFEKDTTTQFQVGDVVVGHLPWKLYHISDGKGLIQVQDVLRPTASLGILGLPGMAAFFGVRLVCDVRKGQTFVITSAAGAVGSAAGQIAKLMGCRVVGVVGTPEKAEYITKSLGFNAAIVHKDYHGVAGQTLLHDAIKRACPDGVDAFFDNSGGFVSDIVFDHLNQNSRVAVCGQVGLVCVWVCLLASCPYLCVSA